TDPDIETVEICPLSGALPGPACPHRHRESFLRGTAPHAACAMHQTVRIDTRNGLRAGPGCPDKFVEARSYEAFDSMYASCASLSARPLASDQYSPLCPYRPGQRDEREKDRVARDGTRVTFPLDGSTFVVDESAASRQMVTLRALAPSFAKRVRFYV